MGTPPYLPSRFARVIAMQTPIAFAVSDQPIITKCTLPTPHVSLASASCSATTQTNRSPRFRPVDKKSHSSTAAVVSFPPNSPPSTGTDRIVFNYLVTTDVDSDVDIKPITRGRLC